MNIVEIQRSISPSEVYLKAPAVLEMLKLQHALNNAYNSSTWFDDNTFFSRFHAASMNELAEFLQESNRYWDWYSKKKDHFDREQALFELVDVIHFCLAGLLTTGSLETVQQDVASYLQEYDSDQDLLMEIPKANIDSVLSRYESFWTTLRRVDIIGTSKGKSEYLGLSCLQMIYMIGNGLALLDYRAEQFLDAYKLKNARNFQRVAGGVMQGVDVKASETPLSLGA